MVPSGTATVAFKENVPGAEFAHILKLETQEQPGARALPVWRRFFCHALISKLPEESLPEVEQRLIEIFEDCVPQQSCGHLTTAFQPRVFLAQQGHRHPRPAIDLED